MPDSTGEQGLPPGPCLPAAIQTAAFALRPFEVLERCRRRYGDRFTLFPVDQPPLIFLADPDEVRALFAGPADVLYPGEGGSAIDPIVGERSFMMVDEDQHLTGRRRVMPAFHSTAVRRHADMVAGLVEREVATWPRDVAFPLHPRLRSLALETVLRTIFSSIAEPRLRELHGRLLRMLSIAGTTLLSVPSLRGVPPWRGTWSAFVRRRREADDLLYALIDERTAAPGRYDDALELICANREEGDPPAAREAMRDDVMSVILAGHETTASALAWAFQLLAHNPAVRDRLAGELDGAPEPAYLRATIWEVLRSRPVFLFTIPRAVKKPVEVAGRRYPPPVRLLGSIYLVHHDPASYPDPHAFRPERFLDEPPDGRLWLPWGGGRKRCPGLHLAVLEMETVLRTVLRTLSVTPAARRIERPLWRNVIVTPHRGSRVILRARARGHGSSPARPGPRAPAARTG